MKILIKFTLTTLSMFSLAACASTPAALKVTPNSGNGAILAKMDPAMPINTARRTGLSIWGDSLIFYRFDGDESEALNGTAKSTQLTGKQMPLYRTGDGYVFLNVKPGRYFLASNVLQTHWASCFNKETILFDVKPDVVTHIGTINLAENIIELQNRVKDSGDNKASGNQAVVQHFYTDMENAPGIIPPEILELGKAKTAMVNADPEFSVDIVSGNNRPFSFIKREQNALGGWLTGTSGQKCGT